MKRKNKLDKYFLLTWKKVGIIIISWIVAVILHNLFFAIFNIEEIFFLLISSIIIPIYVLIVLVYSLIKFLKRRIKKGGEK